MVKALKSRRRAPKRTFRTNRDHRFGCALTGATVRFWIATADRYVHARFDRNITNVASVPLRDDSDAELRLQQIVDGLRIGLAAGLLHHLTDEPAGELRLGFRLRDLVGVGGDDVVDDLFDRAQIRDLLHAARFDQFARVAALGPDDLEQVLGDFSGDRAL